MRASACLIAGLSLSIAVQAQQPPAPAAQPPQTPTFRAGVDLLTVDATVVDGEGRQVEDLAATEFTVQVDGQRRQVVSAEYIKHETALRTVGGLPEPRRDTPAPGDVYFSTNAGRPGPGGRYIVVMVDQGNIRAGLGRATMREAVRFLDRLNPNDYVAAIAIPGPGPVVDFTVEHDKVREALLSIVGQASPTRGRFYFSITEALAIVEHSDAVLRAQVVLRECGGILVSAAELERCERDLEQEAGEFMIDLRRRTQLSLRAMRDVLRNLSAVDVPKSVILISEALVLERDYGAVDEIAAIAADSRASIDVMLLDVSPVDASESRRPTTPREDRELQVQGLEALAGLSRGSLHRIAGSATAAFDRIARALAGYYLIAVEARPSDRDGRRHRVEVRTSRRGLAVLSRRGFLAPVSGTSGTSSAEDAVSSALRAPGLRTEIPIRLATWTYKEPGTTRVRLVVAADIERLADQSLEYVTGLMVSDANGRSVATPVEPRTLTTAVGDPGAAVYRGAITVEPGRYRVRLAVSDKDGRVGSVDRVVDAFHVDGTSLMIGDLLVATAPQDDQGTMAPAVDPRIDGDALAALLEIYGPAAEVGAVEATLEITPRVEDARPIATVPMSVAGTRAAEIHAAQVQVGTATLPPGEYLARAVLREGGTPRGHVVRPFRILPRGAGGATPILIPRELAATILATVSVSDRSALMTEDGLRPVLTFAAEGKPAALQNAIAGGTPGKLGPAALAALEAGDQALAGFLRGLDWYVQGQRERAAQQFQTAMQLAPAFAPARLFLGLSMVDSGRFREGAALLQSVPARAAPWAGRVAGEAWLQAGMPEMAVEPFQRAADAGDAAVVRALALAYVAANRQNEALPLLVKHLSAEPADEAALVAGVYALYSRHLAEPQPATLAADRELAAKWARAYTAAKGPAQGLVSAWAAYLGGLK
ncbi:MAG: VWA domain-containing protein [Acidobacteriota bacterium]